MDPFPSKLGFSCQTIFPPHVNILFRARPPINYIEPEQKKCRQTYSWVLSHNKNIESIFNSCKSEVKLPPPPPKILKIIEHYLQVKKERTEYNPHNDRNKTNNPNKTLFVSNLAYSVTEDILKSKMQKFGKISDIRIVKDKNGKSRGYGFIQFKHSKDLTDAYDHAHKMKIEKRKIKVDYERARIQKSWLPRRLDGGKAGRKNEEEEKFIADVISQYKKGLLYEKYNFSSLKNEDTEDSTFEKTVCNKRIKIREEPEYFLKCENSIKVESYSSHSRL